MPTDATGGIPDLEDTLSVPGDARREESEPEVQRRAGPYRLLQLIGEGGMGEVWLAEQIEPRRRVALKVIKAGMDTTRGGGPFRVRAAGAGSDGPPGHRQGVRRRKHAGGPSVLRHGVRGRRPDHRALRHAQALHRASAPALHRGLRGRPARSPEGHHPPGPQAVEHPGLAVDGRPQPKIIDFGIAKATGYGSPRRRSSPSWGSHRHARVHEPGAGRPAPGRTSIPGPTSTRWASSSISS